MKSWNIILATAISLFALPCFALAEDLCPYSIESCESFEENECSYCSGCFFPFCEECVDGKTGLVDNFHAEINVSYFISANKAVNQIFHSKGINYQLSLLLPINCDPCSIFNRIFLWGAVDYVQLKGRSLFLGDHSTFKLVPITLGLKVILPPLGRFKLSPYFGFGGKYYLIYNHNHNPVVQRDIHKEAVGGVLEAGVKKILFENYLFDFFGSYSFVTVDPPSHHKPNVVNHRINCGGWNIGGGVGYMF
jgi:outer membrane protein W